jgi:hypothetical protein
MRFTVTLDADVTLNLKKLMAAEKLTFKDAVNQTLLRGLRELERHERSRKTRRLIGGGLK